MSEVKQSFFSKFQKHVQDAEKTFQKQAYQLQDEVQKLNKIYQKKLSQIDKIYADEEKLHVAELNTLQKKYTSDTKKLTESAIEKTKAKEQKVVELKQKWQAQQKTIAASFESKLDEKKKALASTEKKREATEKQILKEYKESKKRLNQIKTQTADIANEARTPFLNSLKYYMNRLQDGASDDQKFFKKELSNLKKVLKKIKTIETKINQTFTDKIQDNQLQFNASSESFIKAIKSLNTRTKSYLTQTKNRYTKAFEIFNDSFTTMRKEMKRFTSKIEKLIENNANAAMNLLDHHENTSIKLEQTSLLEIKETETRNHQLLVGLYDEVRSWLDTFNNYVTSLKSSYSERLNGLTEIQERYLESIIQENELISQQLTRFTAEKDLMGSLSIDTFADSYLKAYEMMVKPLLDFQKKWHTSLYKAYKEAKEYYDELDDIQNFYDGFNEEKAIAFENENLHITKKAAQLNIEIETAKKAYEVETLDADQKVLYEKKNRDFLEKIYRAEIQLEKTRLDNAYRSKELETLNAIKKAQAHFKLKERFFNVEKDLLNDKKNYQIAVKKESYGIQKLELDKQLTIEKNDLKLSQDAEMEQHKVAIIQAKTEWSKVKEDKRQFELDLENKYQNQRNQKISSIQKEIDDYKIEIKRLNFEQDREIKDIKQVSNDESLVAKNRVQQFETSLKNRLKSINKPYKSTVKRLEAFYQLLEEPSTSSDELLPMVSEDFKRELMNGLESFYDTLKWTREYYSDLEIAKIKRSTLLPKKQTIDIEKHESGENRYKEALLDYLNVSKNKIKDAFDFVQNKLNNKAFKTPKDLVRAMKTFLDELRLVIEDQAGSTSQEVIDLFEYIKEQDLIFIEEIEYGLNTALNEIDQRYTTLKDPYYQNIEALKESIKTIKSSPLIVPDDSEKITLETFDTQIQQADSQLQNLEQETYQKQERFKADVQALELEFTRKHEDIDHLQDVALQQLEASFEQEKNRIEMKINQAKSHFENIETSETQKLKHAKQTLDYGIQGLTRKYDMIRMRDAHQLDKITRDQEIKKMEAERHLSLTIDDIQKEISSKELQLEAANEKIKREYETKYFEKQTRAQTLYERLDQLQNTLFFRKESLLNELANTLQDAHSDISNILTSESLRHTVQSKFEAHQTTITAFIERKKNAINKSL